MTISTKDGRKFTLCLLVLLVATVALFLRFATFDAWSYLALGDLAIFAGANVAQKATARVVVGKK